MNPLLAARAERLAAQERGDTSAFYRALGRERALQESVTSATGEFTDAVGNLFRQSGGGWQWRNRLGRWIDMPEPPNGALAPNDGMARPGFDTSPVRGPHLPVVRGGYAYGRRVETPLRGRRERRVAQRKRTAELAQRGREARALRQRLDARRGGEPDTISNVSGMKRPGTATGTEDLSSLSFPELVSRIRDAWPNPTPAARPHLDVMSGMNDPNERYGFDMPGESVYRFLSNASQFKGPEARALKAELKQRMGMARPGRISPGGWVQMGEGPRKATVSKRVFEFNPALIDRGLNIEPGTRVRITKLGQGVPPPGTMGHYHIADAGSGEFLGMVAYGSLRPAAEGMSRPGSQEIRPEQRTEILRQIGRMNVASISGGRVTSLPDGIELPVSSGYRVRVRLDPTDTYTVERVMVRGGKEFPKGSRSNVYFDEVSEVAYRAGMYKSFDDKQWPLAGMARPGETGPRGIPVGVHRRTFEAKKHPKGSAERTRLNEDPRTSEYQPSHKYSVVSPVGMSSYRTKAEAEQAYERSPDRGMARPAAGGDRPGRPPRVHADRFRRREADQRARSASADTTPPSKRHPWYVSYEDRGSGKQWHLIAPSGAAMRDFGEDEGAARAAAEDENAQADASWRQRRGMQRPGDAERLRREGENPRLPGAPHPELVAQRAAAARRSAKLPSPAQRRQNELAAIIDNFEHSGPGGDEAMPAQVRDALTAIKPNKSKTIAGVTVTRQSNGDWNVDGDPNLASPWVAMQSIKDARRGVPSLATAASVGRMSTEALKAVLANPNADPALRAAARQELAARERRSTERRLGIAPGDVEYAR